MNIRLSPEQIAALEAQHRQSRNRRVCDKIRCVLLSAQSGSTTMIAQSRVIYESTVLSHITECSGMVHCITGPHRCSDRAVVMNEHARNNRHFATAKASRVAIKRFFRDTLPEIAGKLACRVNDHFQTLLPASSG